MSKEQIVFSVATLLVALVAMTLGIINARYMRRRDDSTDYENDIDDLRRSINELEAEHRVTKKQISLFWGIVEKEVGNMLHSPHREELDRLIEKNTAREELETKEVKRFAELLQEIIDADETSPGERSGAIVYKAAVLARHANVNH